MKDAGSTAVGNATAHHPPQSVINHRKLAATIFPLSKVVGDDRDEMLHCAASQGMLSVVIPLLRAAADKRSACDLPDRFGRTPLHWAAEQGRRNVVHALLRAGACVDPRSQRNATPIMLAASRGHVEVVRMLLRCRASEAERGPLNRHRHGAGHSGRTALHCAAKGGHLRVVELLLDAGFARGQHDGALTPAEISARQSHSTSAAITHLLLPRSDMGGKLVHCYANKWTEDVVTLSGLINGGAFVDWQDGTGDTPLHRAVHFHHVTISRVLLEAGAHPDLRDRLGVSPLHIAARNGLEEVADYLLDAGADLEPLTVLSYCPLHEAVVNNRANVVSLLLDAGASTEHRDTTHGQTPLSWACRNCLVPIVRVLVKAGADVESRSSAGLTPLHWACRFVDAESVEALLNAGADPGAVDQAAADNALEASSSSSSDMSVSMPVALDVIGLGYPPDVDWRRPFTPESEALAYRRLDLGSVRRIESTLQAAHQANPWRRRGWLVILANRWVAMKLSRVQGKTRWAGIRDSSGSLLPGRVSAMPNSDITSDPRHLQEGPADTHDFVSNKLRNVDNAMGMTKEASRQQGNTRGKIGGPDNVEASFPDLVGALIELAAVEVGVFRRVVAFI
ncbi:unnamed protein product [Laminaria digitata]